MQTRIILYLVLVYCSGTRSTKVGAVRFAVRFRFRCDLRCVTHGWLNLWKSSVRFIGAFHIGAIWLVAVRFGQWRCISHTAKMHRKWGWHELVCFTPIWRCSNFDDYFAYVYQCNIVK